MWSLPNNCVCKLLSLISDLIKFAVRNDLFNAVTNWKKCMILLLRCGIVEEDIASFKLSFKYMAEWFVARAFIDSIERSRFYEIIFVRDGLMQLTFRF